jgi:Flp pilus assembly protein TadG
VIARRLPLASRHRALDHLDRDRGAVAVEMALVLPVLLFVLMAMIDFGRGFNAEIVMSQAAREGVRLASLNPVLATGTADPLNGIYGNAKIVARINSAAAGMNFADTCVTPTSTSPTPSSACITNCTAATVANPDPEAQVVLTSYFTWITGISGMSTLFGHGGPSTFPTPNTIQTKGVMRCTG